MALLTVQEAAKLLRVHEDSLRRSLKEGKLPGVKIGRVWRIRRADIEALFDGARDVAVAMQNSKGDAPTLPADVCAKCGHPWNTHVLGDAGRAATCPCCRELGQAYEGEVRQCYCGAPSCEACHP